MKTQTVYFVGLAGQPAPPVVRWLLVVWLLLIVLVSSWLRGGPPWGVVAIGLATLVFFGVLGVLGRTSCRVSEAEVVFRPFGALGAVESHALTDVRQARVQPEGVIELELSSNEVRRLGPWQHFAPNGWWDDRAEKCHRIADAINRRLACQTEMPASGAQP